MIWEKFFSIAQEGFTGLLEACLSFNKMKKIVTQMNNKVAAISKMMELPGDK